MDVEVTAVKVNAQVGGISQYAGRVRSGKVSAAQAETLI